MLSSSKEYIAYSPSLLIPVACIKKKGKKKGKKKKLKIAQMCVTSDVARKVRKGIVQGGGGGGGGGGSCSTHDFQKVSLTNMYTVAWNNNINYYSLYL